MNPKPLTLLTLAAIARRLNIRPRDLRTEVDAGRIPVIRLGDALLFDAHAVEGALLDRARDEKGAPCDAR